MPIIDIAIPDNALSAKAREEIPVVLEQIALEYEGLAGSKFAESFTQMIWFFDCLFLIFS